MEKTDYTRAIERADMNKCDKLQAVVNDPSTNKENYWKKVKKLTRSVTSDHNIGRWQCLAEYFEKKVVL